VGGRRFELGDGGGEILDLDGEGVDRSGECGGGGGVFLAPGLGLRVVAGDKLLQLVQVRRGARGIPEI
jgi:hypothetical protein